MEKQDVLEAYVKIRKIDNTIPDDVLDFMKEAALSAFSDESGPRSAATCEHELILGNKELRYCHYCGKAIKILE